MLGLPDLEEHRIIRKLYNDSAQTLIVVVKSVGSKSGGQYEVYLRELKEKAYRKAVSFEEGIQIIDIVCASVEPRLFIGTLRENALPPHAYVADVPTTLPQGFDWSALYSVDLPSGYMTEVSIEFPKYSDAQRSWIVSMLGMGANNHVLIAFAIEREATAEECERLIAPVKSYKPHAKLEDGRVVDTFIGHLSPDTGVISTVAKVHPAVL
jgi:hypothetical protein